MPTLTPDERFEHVLSDVVQGAHLSPRKRARDECRARNNQTCTLCLASHLTYASELLLKEQALEVFRATQLNEVRFDPLIPSAQGRAYRVVTKRKVFSHGRGVMLGLIDPEERHAGGALPVAHCVIEPDAHRRLYAEVERGLAANPRSALSRRLRYVIVKGSYDEQLLTLSVTPAGPLPVREANDLSHHLSESCPGLAGVFLVEDRSEGRYYLPPEAALSGRVGIRKIFGRPNALIRVDGRTFLYPPGAFTQVNLAMADTLVETARGLLEPTGTATLYDLYCGYGLFALCLSASVRRVIAAEMSHVAVEAGLANARRQHVANVRFHRADITAETLRAIMPHAGPGDMVLLDPPRSGAASGVIEAIAARHVRRVVHIVCNIDLLGRELSRWARSRYRVKRVVPMDLFPGTSSLEMLVVLEPTTQ